VSDTARIIDGRALAANIRASLAERVSAVRARGAEVRLDAVIAAEENTPAQLYAENQAKTCAELGIEYLLHRLPPDAGYDDIAGRVLLLNNDDDVSAIMVHLPVPEGIDPYRIQRLIDSDKDVEGVNPANIGNVVYGHSSLAPCTALAAMKMVESVSPGDHALRGQVAVVVGASNHVGKPAAVLLMRADATVVSCNKWTPELPAVTARGDILVAAAGVPGLITRDMVKPGAIVVDVGVNRIEGDGGRHRTVGDVDFDEVRKVAGYLSPVPGGVGPVTVAMLLSNVVLAAERGS